MDEQPSLGFIGAGKVGHTLARLWYEAGYTVRAVHSRTEAHARALAELTGAAVVTSPAEVVKAADVTLLTVPDDAVKGLANTVAKAIHESSPEQKAVVHTSGALDKGALAALARQGYMVGSLHPAFPFADVETALVGLRGATFAVEADEARLLGWLAGLAAALDGKILTIPPGGKAVYHAALVFASNYTVTLYAIAERLLAGLGAESEAAENALNALVAGTVENLRRQGIPAALTGPLARGDAGTVARHIRALRQADERLADLYKRLAYETLPMISASQQTVMKELLDKD